MSTTDMETVGKTTAALLHSVHQLMASFRPGLEGTLEVEPEDARNVLHHLHMMEMMITALGNETAAWHELYLRAQGELDGQLRRKAVLQ